MAIVLPVLLLLAVLPLGAGQAGATPSERPEILKLGSPVEAALAPGESHAYGIRMQQGHFLHLVLRRWDAAVELDLHEPSGRKIVSQRCREFSVTPLSLLAGSSGVYRLYVRSPQGSAFSGRYRIDLDLIRPGKKGDQRQIDSENALTKAQSLHLNWTSQSRDQAIGLYRKAIDHANPQESVRARVHLGRLFHAWAMNDKAVKELTQALSSSNKSGDLAGAGEALAGLCAIRAESAASKSDQGKDYEEQCQQALQASQASRNRVGEALALNSLGDFYDYQGDPHKPIELFQRAEAVWIEVGSKRGLAQTLLNQCYAHTNSSHHDSAVEFCSRALQLWQELQDIRGEAQTLTTLGHLEVRQGDWQAAIDRYAEALRLFEAMGFETGQASLLMGLGSVYQETDQPARAIVYYERAHHLFKSSGHRSGEADALVYLGEAHADMGDYEAAIRFHEQARAFYEASGNERMLAYPIEALGRISEAMGDIGSAVSNVRKAADLKRKGNDEYGLAYTLNRLARLCAQQGNQSEALRLFKEALSLNRSVGDDSGEALTLANRARFERSRGNFDLARSEMEKSLSKVEELRAGIAGRELRSSYFGSLHDLYEFQIDLLMQIHKREPDSGTDAAAFAVGERGRARSLIESLNDDRSKRDKGVDKDLLVLRDSLKERIKALDKQRRQLAGDPPANRLQLDEEIGKSLIEYEQVRARIRRQSPLYDVDRQAQPLSLQEIQRQVLDEDTVLLEYSIGKERSYLWAVSRLEMSSYELPARSVIEDQVSRLIELLQAPLPRTGETLRGYRQRVQEAERRYWPEAESLSRLVLAPAASKLAGKRILFVPDGPLRYVPFAALPDPAHQTVPGGGEERKVALIEVHEVVRSPSASAVFLLRQESGMRPPFERWVAVFADPVFDVDDARVNASKIRRQTLKGAGTAEADHFELVRALRDARGPSGNLQLPRLFSSRREALSILALVPPDSGLMAIDFEASRAQAINPELGRYRIVHFATHGLLNDKHPELSGIVLSLVDDQGNPQDGFLQLHEIYELNLPVELVVLSACDSALGKEIKGEGLIGLVRGFMYAGASRVLASLWKVEDRAASEMMTRFYRGMIQDSLSPSAALRAAQKGMLLEERWRFPFYWSAFVLQGDWR